VGIVYLDLLFQSSQKDARIILGKVEEASSMGSTMVVKNYSRTLGHQWGKIPFKGKATMFIWAKNN
jgi:hypothetical protein